MRTLLGTVAVLALAFAAGCEGEIILSVGGDDDGEPVTLAFTSPDPGARAVRDTVEPTLGWRAAVIDVTVAVTGTPATIELAAGDLALGTLDVVTGTGQVLLVEPGPATLTATARNAAGEVVATATVELEVAEPEPASCKAWLDLYGAVYTVGPTRVGVSDPVTITTPINGVRYRASGAASPRATFFMDCTLARSLLEAAPHLRARGIVEVTDIGVYNYRCIGGGTPPDCPNGLSQHAYAKGIDIAALTAADGTTYSVNDDWVIDPSTERTCAAATSDAKDALLHDAICALKADQVWNIVLTPNYNADHRNHFHVDLTTGSDFIRKQGDHTDVGPDDY